jgi:hypothetical protein
MTLDQTAPPTGGNPEQDINEDRTRRDRSNDLIKTGADATVEFLSGVTDALSGALRRAGEELDKDDLTHFGIKNGFVRGFFEGSSHFFEKMPTVMRKAHDALSSETDERKRK